MKCRHCRSKLKLELINLGSSPPSNAYLTKETINAPEKWFPLRVLVCENCWLVQTEDFTKADELFNKDYAYFSSFSTSLLRITKNFVADSIKRFSLNANSQFIEVAANDGYLLQYVKENNIPCIGIEPTTSTANVARAKGINIIEKFFGVNLAKQLIKNGKQADFTVANNVLAHVPDINDFVSGFSIILKPNGVSTFEFTHLLKIVNNKLFDTIYHEHFSYLSLITLETIFKKNGLQIFDAEELTTQGGSLRLYAQRLDTGRRKISNKVTQIRKQEIDAKIDTPEFYKEFQSQTNTIKDELLNFLIKAKKDNKKVIAYGAAAKGNTLLNYAGVKPDLISYVMDKNLEKQNKFMPGSRIPIKDENHLKNDKPDFILILPWNLKDEIITQLKYVNNNGAKFVIAVPKLEIV
jgi:2-polyprenyl-3-methyl-5-hydroxy-6-metoxy-1,4-benzoquinol methylase